MAQDKNHPLVSVIITNFNYSRYIDECIGSVLGQEFDISRVEIILVDDGSSDESPFVCSRYSGRISYIYTKNRGMSHALSLGYLVSMGEFYALLSVDDYWLPEKLKKSVDLLMRDESIVMVGHRHIKKSATMEQRDYCEMKYIREIDSIDTVMKSRELGRGEFLQGSSMVFRKRLMSSFMPVPPSVHLFNDQYMSHAAMFCGKVGLINDYLAVFRQHENNYYSKSVGREGLAKTARQYTAFVGALTEWLKANSLCGNSIAADFIAFSRVEASYLKAVLHRNTLNAFLLSLQRTRHYNPGASLRKRLYLYLGCLMVLFLGIADYTRWMQGLKIKKMKYIEVIRRMVRFFR